MSRVFVSSASGEYLAQFRQAAVDVCHRLQHIPVHMEEFHPESPPPLHVCEREVDGSDAFVLLVAHRYGSRPPGNALSYTELEYERALERGLDIHVFIVDPVAPWPPGQVDHGDDAEALRRFVDRLKKNHVVRPFADANAFREELLLTLREDSRPKGSARPQPRRTPVRPAPHAVPPYVSSQPFVGRTGILAELDGWATSADPVLVVEAIGGLGKSALCWRWFNDHAPKTMDGLAGRLWWSFYEGSASITRFLQEAVAYLTGRSVEDCTALDRTDLLGELIQSLRTSPNLLVLDGFERLLTAYHRFDPTRLRDDEVDGSARSLTDPYAYQTLRTLLYCAPSKVLISSRLMPKALEGAAGWPIEGVYRLRLPGLTGDETVGLVRRLGVIGRNDRVTNFFDRLGNHPLLIGAACGMVRDYRQAPADFDAWLADPSAGAAIKLSNLRLSGRQTRVLTAVFDGLDPGHLRVVQALSLLPGGSSFAALEAVNPYRPERAVYNRWAPFGSLDEWVDHRIASGHIAAKDRWTERDNALANLPQMESVEPSGEADQQAAVLLDRALQDLESRGLLMWDRATNTYDLHPVVRAFAHDRMNDDDRMRTNKRVRDHFTALPPEDLDRVTSVEDLKRTITVFRALVGAGYPSQAAGLYSSRLRLLLYEQLGANTTIIELLQPLAEHPAVASSYANGLHGAGRFDEAHVVFTDLAGKALAQDGPTMLFHLDALIVVTMNRGSLAVAQRLLQYVDQLSQGFSPSRPVVLLRAGQLATETGRYDEARDLLGQAQEQGADIGAFVQASIAVARISLAVVDGTADDRLLRDLDHIDPRVSGQFHVTAARLKAEYWLRRGRLGRALAAADEYTWRSRDKGLSPALGQALNAWVFASAGNPSQARALVEEALAGINGVHPAERPYGDIAEALVLLHDRRAGEAAVAEYRRAWADGPPYCRAAELRRAEDLIRQSGAVAPILKVTDPTTLHMPFEEELQALVDKDRGDG